MPRALPHWLMKTYEYAVASPLLRLTIVRIFRRNEQKRGPREGQEPRSRACSHLLRSRTQPVVLLPHELRRVALWQMFPPSALAPRIILCRRVVSLHSRDSSLGMASRVRFIRCLASRSTGADLGYVLIPPHDALAESTSSTTLPTAASSCQQGTSMPLEDLEPQEPGPEDCCQQGCYNCVWNIYRDQHRLWAERNGKVVQPGPADTMLDRLEREIEEKARARRAQACKDQKAS